MPSVKKVKPYLRKILIQGAENIGKFHQDVERRAIRIDEMNHSVGSRSMNLFDQVEPSGYVASSIRGTQRFIGRTFDYILLTNYKVGILQKQFLVKLAD